MLQLHPGRPFPSLAHFSGNGSYQGGPATFQDSPPAPIPQPQPRKATPSHRSPCPQKAPRPDSAATGPASFPKVSPPPHDTCPAQEAGKGHQLLAPPLVIATVSGDAGLPARKRPAPGVPWSLLIPKTLPHRRHSQPSHCYAAERLSLHQPAARRLSCPG